MTHTKVQSLVCLFALATACGGSETEPASRGRASAKPAPSKAKAPAKAERESDKQVEPKPAISPGAYTLEGDPPVVITPLQHASFYVQVSGKTIHVDPTKAAMAGAGEVPPADLILVTHGHGDHLDPEAIAKLRRPGAPVVAPEANAAAIPDATALKNGEKKTVAGVELEAIAMYNLERKNDAGELFHPKGQGNGYVLGIAGRRIYVAGDTECVPEIRALEGIDAAFICMNLPYTMNVEEAAECVAAFGPKLVFPYHHKGQDTDAFKSALAKTPDIKVEVLDWYPEAAKKPTPG